MLNIMSELLLILSIFTPSIILKGILTYKKENRDRSKILFYILLLLIYIIVKLSRLFHMEEVYAYNMITLLVIVLWAIYYNYFYITGINASSEESLLVPYLENIKIDIYSNLFIIFIYILVCLIIKHLDKYLQSLGNDKRNYIYLSLGLIVNLINIIISYVSKKLERFNLYSEQYILNYIVTPKLILASTIVLVLLFVKVIKDNKVKSQKELMKNKLDMQYEHYLSVQESHMKVRKLYHDINNHISTIDNHIKIIFCT